MPDQWMYRRSGEEHGPVSPSQLKDIAASGQLEATDLVWREGLAEWVPAKMVKGLFPPAAVTPSTPVQPSKLPAASAQATPPQETKAVTRASLDDLRRSIIQFVLDAQSLLPQMRCIEEFQLARRQLQHEIEKRQERIEQLRVAQLEYLKFEKVAAESQKALSSAVGQLSSLAKPLGQSVFDAYRKGGVAASFLADRVVAHDKIEQLRREQEASVPTASDGLMAKAKAKGQQLMAGGKIKIEKLKLGKLNAEVGNRLIAANQESQVQHPDTARVLEQIADARSQIARCQEQANQAKAVLDTKKSELADRLGIGKIEGNQSFDGEIEAANVAIKGMEGKRNTLIAELPGKLVASPDLPTEGRLAEMVNELRKLAASEVKPSIWKTEISPIFPAVDLAINSADRRHSNSGTSEGGTSAPTAAPPLWNPRTAAIWSLLFSWAFGSFLIARNWRSLGDSTRAKRSMLWFYAFIGWLLLAILTPDSNAFTIFFRVGGFVIFMVWCFREVGQQASVLKSQFNNSYPRKKWWAPLGVACVSAATFVGIAAIAATAKYGHETAQSVSDAGDRMSKQAGAMAKKYEALANSGSASNVAASTDDSEMPGRKLVASVGTGASTYSERMTAAMYNAGLKSVKCSATEDQLIIEIETNPAKRITDFRLLVRLFDRNGQYLTHFTTSEMFTNFPAWKSNGHFTFLNPTGNRFAYPVNVRDLRDTAQVEIGFVETKW